MDIHHVLERAKILRQHGCMWQAHLYYDKVVHQLGVQISTESKENKRVALRALRTQLQQRLGCLEAEYDLNGFQSKAVRLHVVNIPEHTFNYDFGAFLANFCNANFQELIVYESHVCHELHLANLLKLALILKSNCSALKFVLLKCRRAGDSKRSAQALRQEEVLTVFRSRWPWHLLHFDCVFSDSVSKNEHKIIFSNGFVFFFKKGFNYFTYNSANDKDQLLSRTAANEISVWFANQMLTYDSGNDY